MLKKIEQGNDSTFFVFDNGVLGCGDNRYGMIGMDGAAQVCIPTLLPNSAGIQDVITNRNKDVVGVFFLMKNGTVEVCGTNKNGVLGIGGRISAAARTLIPGLSSVVDIKTNGMSTYFLLSNGTVKSCGDNYSGQLGQGDYVNRNTPTLIPGLDNVREICVSNHNPNGFDVVHFLLNNGTIKGCGSGGNYLVGAHPYANKYPSPTLVAAPSGPLTNVKKVIQTLKNTYFLLNDGTVFCCGGNEYFQLCAGESAPNQYYPVLIYGVTSVKDIAAMYGTVYFLHNDGTVKSCGCNLYGELGLNLDPAAKDRLGIPGVINGLNNVKNIIARENGVFFLQENGVVQACGSSTAYRLGFIEPISKISPCIVPELNNVDSVYFHHISTFFLCKDGIVKICGTGYSGSMGMGSLNGTYAPPTVLGLTEPQGPTTIAFLYLKNTQAYAEQNNVLTKVSDDYPSLSSTDKKALFLAAAQALSSADKLNTLGAFKILRYSGEAQDSFSVTAIPKPSILKPKSLLNIPNISKVTATGNGKVFVTTDLLTYKAYDGTAWTESEIGMDASELPNITRAKWRELGASIAFAYLIDMESTSETKEIGDLTIETQAPDQGYEAALKGADYTYSYPNESTLRVKFLTDGNYKINWS